MTIYGTLCPIGSIHLLGCQTRFVLQLGTTHSSWNMVHIHCNSMEVKELAPKGILYPVGNVYYNHQCNPLFVTFSFKTTNGAVKTGGGQVLAQISTINC